jgi:sorbitol-specific phosphotransferase system component IIBC
MISDIARRFCIEQQTSLGYGTAASLGPLTEQNLPSCVTPIATYLQNSINQYNTQQQNNAAATQQQQRPQTQNPAAATQQQSPGMVAVRLTIDDNTFEISFRPTVDSLDNVSKNFCVQQAEVIGLKTQADLENCVREVMGYLANQLQQAQGQGQAQA